MRSKPYVNRWNWLELWFWGERFLHRRNDPHEREKDGWWKRRDAAPVRLVLLILPLWVATWLSLLFGHQNVLLLVGVAIPLSILIWDMQRHVPWHPYSTIGELANTVLLLTPALLIAAWATVPSEAPLHRQTLLLSTTIILVDAVRVFLTLRCDYGMTLIWCRECGHRLTKEHSAGYVDEHMGGGRVRRTRHYSDSLKCPACGHVVY